MRGDRAANLAFFAGKFDAIPLGVTIPTLKDFKEQRRRAICEVDVGNVPRTMLNQPAQAAVRQSGIATRDGVSRLDRKAFVDILNEGVGNPGATMLPPPTASGHARRRCFGDPLPAMALMSARAAGPRRK